jgi:hypothetical protein
MANIIRSAKSGSDWTNNELNSYNIKIVSKNDVEFFGEVLESLPKSISHELLEYDFSSGEERPERYAELLILLNSASTGLENKVDSFASMLLRASGYIKKDRVIGMREILNLVICGESRFAQTDVSVLGSEGSTILLVQEDKRIDKKAKDPEPQVIAEAIAAFQKNNKDRIESNLEEIDSMTIPCITMKGTFPIFYLVPVTSELSNCIIGGIYPSNVTEVFRYAPDIPIKEGMKLVESRREVLQCYESFKKFVDDLEEQLRRE